LHWEGKNKGERERVIYQMNAKEAADDATSVNHEQQKQLSQMPSDFKVILLTPASTRTVYSVFFSAFYGVVLFLLSFLI